MTVKTREIIEAVSVLAEHQNIRVTVSNSLKASGIAGVATFLGALLLGPIGIIAGSVSGGLIGYNMSKGKFKSAVEVLKDDLTEDQRERLSQHVVEAFKDFGPQDIAMLIPLITANGPFQKIVIGKLVEFLTNEMRMQIID